MFLKPQLCCKLGDQSYRHGDAHFFDLHPPFSRLLHYYASTFLDAPECAYTKHMAFAECDMWQMRAVPCALGTLLVPLAYAAARGHGCGPTGGLAAAFLVGSDAMFFALSRIHLLDMVTLATVAATVVAHARLLRAVAAPPEGDAGSGGSSQWASKAWKLLWLVARVGAWLGLAVSSKFGAAAPTAVWCVATLGLACADGAIRRCRWAGEAEASAAAAAAVAVGATAAATAAGKEGSGVQTQDMQQRQRRLRWRPRLWWWAREVGRWLLLSGALAASSLGVYVALLAWHFSLIPWKGPEDGSYAVYSLTKKRLGGVALDGFLDQWAERLVLSLDYSPGSSVGLFAKVAEFTMEQVYYYVQLDG